MSQKPDFEDVSDVSSIDDDIPEYRREMLIAEKHAEHLKRKQMQRLLEESNANLGKRKEFTQKDPSGLDQYNFGQDDDLIADVIEDQELEDKTLFSEPLPKVAQISIPSAVCQAARVTKTRLLHILEHPQCSEYLSGVLLKVLVSQDEMYNTGQYTTIASANPQLVGKHVVFMVDSLKGVDPYPVYGNRYKQCDHEKRNVIARAIYKLVGKVMSREAGLDISANHHIISINDVCNLGIEANELTFGSEALLIKLEQVSLRLKRFTFTDEDVKNILKKKYFTKEKSGEYEEPKTKGGLIIAIQRINHEIELLGEMSSEDPGNIGKLEELEARKLELEARLRGMKEPNQMPAFPRASAVFRPTNFINDSMRRKTTQPTAMIMVPSSIVKENLANEGNASKEDEKNKRTICDIDKWHQQRIVDLYKEHVKGMEMSMWGEGRRGLDVEETKEGLLVKAITLGEYGQRASQRA